MADQTDAFVVPAGLLLEQDEQGLSIEHEGDIVLHGTLGQRLRRVHSRGGSVVLHLDAELEELAAPRGDVTVHGTLRTGTVRGRRVTVLGPVHADGVYGGSVRIEGDVDAGVVSAQEGGVRIEGSAVVRAEIESDGGDVVIDGQTTAGGISARAGRIHVGGPVRATEIVGGTEVRLPSGAEARTVSARGEVHLGGEKVDVEQVRGGAVTIGATQARVASAQASERIEVTGGAIESDIFIAPTVLLDAETTGRITGIDSKNDPGASRVRGCLRLDELAWYLGDVEAFLEERGLRRLDAPPVEEEEEGPALGASPTMVPLKEDLAEFAAVEEEDTDPGADRAAAEEAARLQAEQAAAEEAARLQAERAEQAAAEEAARIEAEQAAAEEAARLRAEQAAAEQAARLRAEQAAAEQAAAAEAARLEAERAAAEAARLEAERAAAEQAAAEQAAAEQAAAEQAAAEQAAAEQAAAEQAAQAAAPEDEEAALRAAIGEDAVSGPEVAVGSEVLFDLNTDALGPDEQEPDDDLAPEVLDEDETGSFSAVATPPAVLREQRDSPTLTPLPEDTVDDGAHIIEEVPASRPTDRVLEEPSGLMLREDVEAAQAEARQLGPAAEEEDATPVEAVEVEEVDEDQPTTVQPAPPPVTMPQPTVAAPAPAPAPAPVPAPAPPPAQSNDPIYMLMLETVGRMTSCYADSDMPPPVQELRSLVEQQDYDGIRSGFSGLWSELVDYHKERGLQLQPRVSHTFRTIDTIVRNL